MSNNNDEKWMTFRHKHVMHVRCDMHNCPTDRYLDGDHYFTDKLVIARPGKENVIIVIIDDFEISDWM